MATEVTHSYDVSEGTVNQALNCGGKKWGGAGGGMLRQLGQEEKADRIV